MTGYRVTGYSAKAAEGESSVQYYSISYGTNGTVSAKAVQNLYKIAGNVTFYADWTPLVYNITYKDADLTNVQGAEFTGTHTIMADGSTYPVTHNYNADTLFDIPQRRG